MAKLYHVDCGFKIKFLHNVVFVGFHSTKANKEFVGNFFIRIVFAPEF